MTSQGSRAAALNDTIGQARHLLLSFDGLVCTLFSGTAADSVTSQLRKIIAREDIPLPDSIEASSDWLDILRFAASISDHLASHVEAQLADLESSVAAAALPTPYVHDVLAACRESGRSVAVISASSLTAVHTYLDSHDLASQIAAIAARTGPDPAILPPSPHLIKQAANAVEASPAECVLIGCSPIDIQAARAAGALSVGYAKTLDDAESLTAAGANAFVYSLADIALSLRSRPVRREV